MAHAYATALLGDRALAEEATQQALALAWERLAQLRAREAFAAWLRRIVRSECHRIRRRARAQMVPLAEAGATADGAPDAGERLDDGRLRAAVLRGIDRLPERQRQVALLYYEHQHSLRDIAAFLRARPSAVAQRLHAARRRLRGAVAEILEHGDEIEWPRGDDLHLRARPARGKVRRRYVVEDAVTRRPVARAAIEATPFRPIYRLSLDGEADALRAGAGDRLLDRLLDDLRALDAIAVWLRAPAQATDLLELLDRHGFRETARVRELRLALRGGRAPAARRSDVAVASLADERRREPAFVAKLRDLLDELRAEDPARPFVPVPLLTVERWLRNRDLSLETGFLARRGDDYIGLADLRAEEDPPALTYIGVARRARGRGIATALVRAALAAARAAGARAVSARVGVEHESALAFFERLGFRRVAAHVTVERCLRDIADIDPRGYESYSGRYAFGADDLRRRGWTEELTITIARRGDRLVSQSRDMVDHWLPGRDGRFFVKEHYGTIRFVRDARGRVTHLVYGYGGDEMSARRID